MTCFSKMLPWFTKKSPGQSSGAYVADRTTLQFSRFENSLQPFACKESLACKHKNNSMNNNVSLRVTTVDMTYFVAVCATRTRA